MDFIHKRKLPFWEKFEYCSMDTFEYDPTYHHLIINGDGVKWITSFREHFQKNATFVINRFHVASDVQCIFRDHSRYRFVRKKLADYDSKKGFIVELNSAVSILGLEKKE